MSKYEPLWKWIKENGTDSFKLTYAEIEEIDFKKVVDSEKKRRKM